MKPDTTDALLAFLFAGSVAWMLVPTAESFARKIGAIDTPNPRSLHDTPTPRLGGLAIMVAVLGAGAIWLPWNDDTRVILAGAAAITLIGVFDDVFTLKALPKFAGQVGAAVIPVAGGVKVDTTTLPFVGGFELGWIAAPLTVIGIVAIINVINFIDGVDGLASGVCAISAAALAVIALSLDRTEAGVLAAITAGASIGFLRHGFPPASSFMGDTGSNLLGYLLAVTAVQGSLKTNAVLSLALPLLVLAVPILDTGFVVAKRIRYRKPIYQADRWHFHHRMANIGFSQRRTLAYLYGWTTILAGLALALRYVPYSDDRGHFDVFWTVVMAACLLIAIAASVYVVIVLEILKLRRIRLRERFGRGGGPDGGGNGAVPPPRIPPRGPSETKEEIDEGVAEELETGSFPAVAKAPPQPAPPAPDPFDQTGHS